jgi:hypothetical protein
MLLGCLGNTPAHRRDLGSDALVHLIDRLWALEDHSEVIEQLGFRAIIGSHLTLRDLMKGQVVSARAEIHIVRVRFPDRLKAEKLFIESARARQIDDTQGYMSKASMEWSGHVRATSEYVKFKSV